MSERLPKKWRNEYSRRMAKKLTEMGIEDKIIMQDTGKKRSMFMKNRDGSLKMGPDGKPQEIIVTMQVARNIFRNTIRNLRNQSVETIEAFLNVPVPKR